MSLINSLPDPKANSSSTCLGEANENSDAIVSPNNPNGRVDGSSVQCDETSECADSKGGIQSNVETMIAKQLYQRPRHNFDNQNKPHQQQNQIGRNAKKKHRRRYKSSKRKDKYLIKKEMSTHDIVTRASAKTESKPLPVSPSYLKPLMIEVDDMKVPNPPVCVNPELTPPQLKRHSMVLGRKKFTLPIVSARSSRRIFPQKRYLQEEELDVTSKKKPIPTNGNQSSSCVTGVTTTKTNSPGNADRSKKSNKGPNTKRSRQPLIVTGKRRWKPQVKLQLKLLEKDLNVPAVADNLSSSMGSDFIKPDMVSKYADKMAEKPKERRLKNGESKKNVQNPKEEDAVEKKEKPDLLEKKCVDPLERVAAKIEKILRSQWEGRLNQANVPPPPAKSENVHTMKVKTSPLSQWKNEQEQRACDRKRTKNLIRKAKLQLKKRTLMKLRQPQSIALLNEQLKLENSKTGTFTEKRPNLSSPTYVEWPVVPIELKKSPVPPKFDVPASKACCVCSLSTTVSPVQKYYGQLACDACSKFFGNFIETPKQYFCSKDGNCSSSVKEKRNTKVSNTRYRCKACWLKSCMQHFSVSAFLRDQLLKFVPRLEAAPHSPLIEDSTALLKFSNIVDFAPTTSVIKPIANPDLAVIPDAVKNTIHNQVSDTKSVDKGAQKLNNPDTETKASNVTVETVSEPSPPIDTAEKTSQQDACLLAKSDSVTKEKNSGLVPKDVLPVAVKSSVVDTLKSSPKVSSTAKENVGDEVSTSVPLKCETALNTTKEELLPKPEEMKRPGPRIKHVCRRAAVVLGLPKATFTEPTTKKHFNLSALPREEKQKLLTTETDTVKIETKGSKVIKSCTTLSSQSTTTKVSIDICKKQSLMIQKKQKKKKLLLKKSFKHFHKHSFKKPLKLTHKLLIKNQLKYSYKRYNKTAIKAPLKLPAKRTTRFRKVRCKQCDGCLAEDCGQCSYCLDKKKFGGLNVIKQACMFRRCLRPMMPASEKRALSSSKNNEDQRASIEHINVDSRSEDSMLGIGTSLLNSSCSPSLSPDNSSCGSSCSSSSSSSSSGSSSSSSDSSSSSSNDSSNSKHSNSSNNNSSSHCSNIDNVSKDSPDIRNGMPQPSFLYETTFNNGFAVDFDAVSSQINFVNSVDLSISDSLVDANDSECTSNSGSGKGICNKSKRASGKNASQEKEKDCSNRNDRDQKEDDGRDKKHLIVADYWRGQSREKVRDVGFALVTSKPLPHRSMCFLCGSAGTEKFIYCVVCCEPYHLFCADESTVPKNLEDWCCRNCQTCAVCGLKRNLLKCHECQYAYHTDCLGSFYPSKPSRKKKIWVCPKCVKCKSCGTTNPSPGSSNAWNFDLLLCHSCSRLKDKGNFCPICHKCYEDDDYDSEMMQCSKCNVWVHAKCEQMTDEQYQILSGLPETVVYTCFSCTVDFPPVWKLAVENTFDTGIKKIMQTLLNAKCTKHLVSRKVPNENLFSRTVIKSSGPDDSSQSSNSLLGICSEISDAKKEENKKPNSGIEFIRTDVNPVETNLPCDNLTIVTNLHKSDVLDKQFLSTTSRSEFSSPMSSKSSVTDSGIDCDNSEGDTEKSDMIGQQSEGQKCLFISAGIVESDATNNSCNSVDKNIIPTPSNSCLHDASNNTSFKELTNELSCSRKDTGISNSKVVCESIEIAKTENVVKAEVAGNGTASRLYKSSDPIDLMAVKKKLSSHKYKSVSAFVNDVVAVFDSQNEEGKRNPEHVARSFCAKLVEQIFPWFKVTDSKLWDCEQMQTPNGLLPHASLPPSDDHVYAAYLMTQEKGEVEQPPTFKSVLGKILDDFRKCALCGTAGDSSEKDKGRLLYCGQDDWIHLNCALWSAEVFQETDGVLKNVYSAISRGKLMRCERCGEYGATVGCCVRGCPSNFHYSCARKAKAIFQKDKKVFCDSHRYCNDSPIIKEDDFEILQRIYISQEDIQPKWVKRSWMNGMAVDDTHVMIGSLSIESLGYLTATSDLIEHLVPINFECTRMFWSTKNPLQRVMYKCRTVEVIPEDLPVEEVESENLTIAHTPDVLKVEQEQLALDEAKMKQLTSSVLNSGSTIPQTLTISNSSDIQGNLSDARQENLNQNSTQIHCDPSASSKYGSEIDSKASDVLQKPSIPSGHIKTVESSSSNISIDANDNCNNICDKKENPVAVSNLSAKICGLVETPVLKEHQSPKVTNLCDQVSNIEPIPSNAVGTERLKSEKMPKLNVFSHTDVDLKSLSTIHTCRLIIDDIISKVVSKLSKQNNNNSISYTSDCGPCMKQNSISEDIVHNDNGSISMLVDDLKYSGSSSLKKGSKRTRSSVRSYPLRSHSKHGTEYVNELEKQKTNIIGNHVLDRYTGLPQKVSKLIDTILPSCPVTETVLPVFHVEKFSKMNGHLDHNSSCSENNYEKESRLLRRTPARLSKLKSDSSASKKTNLSYATRNHKLKSQTEMDICEQKKGNCNQNGSEGTLNKNILVNGTSKHCILTENDVIEDDSLVTTDLQNDNITTVMDKVMAYNLSRNCSSKTVDNIINNREIVSMCKKLVTVNGCVQDLGPFKCSKCKRSYRTKTSFEKHISSCDFIVDSSSDEDEENSQSPPPSQKVTVNNLDDEKKASVIEIEEKSQTFQQNLADELDEVEVLQVIKELSGSAKNNGETLVNGNNRECELSVNDNTEMMVSSETGEESSNIEHKIDKDKVNSAPEFYHVVECDRDESVLEEKTVTEFMDCSSSMSQNTDGQISVSNACENLIPLTPVCDTDKEIQLSKCEEVDSSFDNPMQPNPVLYNGQSVNVLPETHFSRDVGAPTPSRSTGISQTCSSFSQNFSPRPIFPKTSQSSVRMLPNSQSLHQPLQMHPNQPLHMHHPMRHTINQQSVNVQQVNQPMNATLNPMQQLSHYNSVPIEQCGANVDVVSIPLASSNFQDSMAIGYGNNTYRNPHHDVVQMPNGTLIFPQDSNLGSQTIPTVNGMPIMTNGFSQLFSPTIDLNQNSQLSYVGSITITNSASMSLSLNMPGQIMSNIPVYPSQVIPQQNLAFGQPQLMQAPLQLQPNAAVQLSTLNVQQLTLQSSCGATGLTPMVFPAQTPVQGMHSPVMFVEEAAVQSQMNALSSFSQSSNLVLQMPVGIDQQPQNCYQTFVPNNFSESPTFTPHASENFCENNVLDPNIMVPCNVQSIDPCVSSYSLNPTTIPSSISSFENNIVCQKTYNANNNKPAVKAILPKVLMSNQCNNSPVCIKPVGDAAGSVSNIFPNEQSSGPNTAPDGNIVDIIKKAAQQMLNLSAELAKKKSVTPDPVSQPASSEKKTRFAHTRKVAARKAQQLKIKQLRTHASSPVTISSKQPEYLHLKISAVPANQAQYNSSPSTNITPDLRIAKATEQICHVSPQHLDVSHSVVIDQSSQDLFELSNDGSALLNLYQEKEKQAQHNHPPKHKPHVIYEISSEDGFHVQSHNIHDAWAKVYEELQDARIASKMHQIMFSKEDINGIQMMGLNNKILTYLLEQLPGSENCIKYKFSFHKPVRTEEKLPENLSGCARSETFANRREYDMFNFLASEHRDRPVFHPVLEDDEGAHKSGRRATNTDLSMAMRFRHLKTIARETVGVYRSSIHGRGLFCKRNIDPGELVIEYAGEVIRSVLTDKREQMYQSKGIGCYMFRIDDEEVVDATMHGNAARFINHSCEPNCFSKVINVDGKKHIVIFALRKILRGEELTYDYKFPFEDEKIPCSCNSRRCRKYLN